MQDRDPVEKGGGTQGQGPRRPGVNEARAGGGRGKLTDSRRVTHSPGPPRPCRSSDRARQLRQSIPSGDIQGISSSSSSSSTTTWTIGFDHDLLDARGLEPTLSWTGFSVDAHFGVHAEIT
ncbi:hypothetical protein MJO28_012671 [Puccinia striiformis f. sp. tritici]|uniref:Uncharacterized protein n=1 Tax=Puccinia striiformis f. sp. tritici TaxID=168172 RepID=A0ACC0E2J5_9BASI|nr:hypothetical protein Pst134EA_022450 [Puccinia striiformis f. sp. tritici]KAH9454962.1 hypothetical protein Pst134EA_022450 [Puccinia striiformis f. sp. tritici]KAI7942644.1 hypothetical protein MJO28_012671 [Puccinia striiformis f. sp. tritici]KAI7945371.1 hypothetical protein MJO29_011759 [Puccinia striiformis f. sp. tritici]